MKRFLALLPALALAALPLAASAQRVTNAPADMPTNMPGAPAPPPAFEDRVAAVVNDDVISTLDIEARMSMAFLASGLSDTPEVRQRLLMQTLRSLIDEKLELQEAKKNDITVSDAEIDKVLARIAHDNNIPGGDMKAFLASRGIPPETIINQIRASIAWSKVIQRELRPGVQVGDDEVDAVIDRMRANAGKEDFLVSEIFLAVDSPKDDEQVRQFAENLVQQLRQGGNFSAIARQFSQSASAASGGDIGWIEEGQLAPDLNHALASMQTNQVAGPVRAGSGYYILGLRDKRVIALASASDVGDISVELQQAFRPYATAAGQAAAMQEADRLRASITGCTNLNTRLAAQFPDWNWQDLGAVKLSDAPSWLADKTRALSVGKASDTMATGKGALILFVCNRKMPESKIDRGAITDQIGTEKLELQARSLLRNLRREAYLDVRIASIH